MMWGQALTHYGAETAEKKAALEQHLMQLAERITDATVRQHMRDYFRNRIFTLGRVKKIEKQKVIDMQLSPLPAADDDISHLRRLEEQLVAIVLMHPDILHQSEIEEHFGHMDFTQPVLDKLRALTLEVSAGAPSVDAATLSAALAERGHKEKVEILLQNTAALSSKFRTHLREDPRAAARAFEQAYDALTMKKLEREKHEAERVLADDMSEKNYERFRALQAQWEELQRNRYEITPDEQIS